MGFSLGASFYLTLASLIFLICEVEIKILFILFYILILNQIMHIKQLAHGTKERSAGFCRNGGQKRVIKTLQKTRRKLFVNIILSKGYLLLLADEFH